MAAALEAGILKPIIGQELPLEKAVQAHINMIHQKGARGKMILNIE